MCHIGTAQRELTQLELVLGLNQPGAGKGLGGYT